MSYDPFYWDYNADDIYADMYNDYAAEEEYYRDFEYGSPEDTWDEGDEWDESTEE